MEETITWIEPYDYCYEVPITVDVNVMSSFSEFYIHLLGFVNYKLYSDAGLSYPPLLKTQNEPDHHLDYYEERAIYIWSDWNH